MWVTVGQYLWYGLSRGYCIMRGIGRVSFFTNVYGRMCERWVWYARDLNMMWLDINCSHGILIISENLRYVHRVWAGHSIWEGATMLMLSTPSSSLAAQTTHIADTGSC